MKLGLLVVLAVVAVVPSLTEGRIVSKCELKEELERAITLPRDLQRYKDNILAAVVCELNRRSSLNSGLVNVYGRRRTTTTARPTTRFTTVSTRATDTPTPIATTTQPAPIDTTTQPAPIATTTQPAPIDTTTQPAPIDTTTQPAPIDTTTQPAPIDTTTQPAPIATTNETTTTNSTFPGRRKRDVQRNSKECDKLDRSLVEILKNVESMFDEEELQQDNHRMCDEDEDSDEKKNRGHEKRWKCDESQPWSLGLYGLFQLSDGHFCNSGYRWSRNVCHTDCTAFTDDDIRDDVACVEKTRYWWYLLKNAPGYCFHTCNFFSECE